MKGVSANWAWKPNKIVKSQINRGDKKCDPCRDMKEAKARDTRQTRSK